MAYGVRSLRHARQLPRFQVRTQIARIAVAVFCQLQHGQHVLGDRRIHIPQVGRVPPAVLFGVVPGEQEICDAPGLAGVGFAIWHKRPNASRGASLWSIGFKNRRHCWACRDFRLSTVYTEVLSQRAETVLVSSSSIALLGQEFRGQTSLLLSRFRHFLLGFPLVLRALARLGVELSFQVSVLADVFALLAGPCAAYRASPVALRRPTGRAAGLATDSPYNFSAKVRNALLRRLFSWITRERESRPVRAQVRVRQH